jgi:hypothetical protein
MLLLRAVGETEPTQGNIQNGFSRMKEPLDCSFWQRRKLLQCLFISLFSSALPELLNFPLICFLTLFLSLRALLCFTNLHYRSIWVTSPLSNCSGLQEFAVHQHTKTAQGMHRGGLIIQVTWKSLT